MIADAAGGGSGDASGASKTCANCGLAPPKPVCCTRCLAAWYCDRPCQLACYAQHKKPCKRAAKARAAAKAAKKGGGAAAAGGGAAAKS